MLTCTTNAASSRKWEHRLNSTNKPRMTARARKSLAKRAAVEPPFSHSDYRCNYDAVCSRGWALSL